MCVWLVVDPRKNLRKKSAYKFEKHKEDWIPPVDYKYYFKYV